MVKTSFGDTPRTRPDVDLPGTYGDDLEECLDVWQANMEKNLTRRRYFDGKVAIKNIGVSIPDDLAKLPIRCGWPAKAVQALAVRSRFDGYSSADDTTEIDRIVDANRLKRAYKNLVRAQLIYGLAFATVTKGGRGEPDPVIRCYSAVNAACTWDYGLRRIKAGLTVNDVDRDGNPILYMLHEPDCVIAIRRDGDGWTADEPRPHDMGRPLMEPFVYDADDDHPLGRSRITRTAMDITDRMMRESLRTELASELSAVPSKVILGGTKKEQQEAVADKSKWSMYVDAVNWLTKDVDGDKLTVQQMAQPSMEPHVSYMDFLASQFSEETSVPLEMLGIRSKTYTSVNSAAAANEPLVIAARDMNEDNGETLSVIGRMALAVSRNVAYEDLEDEPRLVASFMDPSLPSVVSTADAAVK
ncbi:MAG: phage portal protein [Coriobacteriales bacterium]